MNLRELTIETAKPLEGTVFVLETAEGEKHSLKLEEVVPYETHQRRRPRKTEERKRQPFALYFLTSATEPLAQGMYTLRSENVTFENLFIVPVSGDEEGVEYEAVFN